VKGLIKHHEVAVSELPMCDICKKQVAAYDAKMKAGPWAYMCESCFGSHGISTGLGLGQRLIWCEPVNLPATAPVPSVPLHVGTNKVVLFGTPLNVKVGVKGQVTKIQVI